MSLNNLSSAQLAHLIDLVKEKESLHSKLERVNRALSNLDGETPSGPKKRGPKPGGKRGPKPGGKRGRKRGRPALAHTATPGRRKTSKRGKRLKEPLLEALKDAGTGGITVKDLAAKLKVKPNNIFSWFYTTGKKIKGISKVGEAKYAYAD